jgi:hypothetical protein
MSVALKAESKMALISVLIASVYCKLLDLNGFEQKQLFKAIINRFLLE